MIGNGLPLTYDECRARFRLAAVRTGRATQAHPIHARGPEQQHLTLESLTVGAQRPRRALVVMSGVHGVEGFIGSALQCDLLGRLNPAALPDDVAVLFLHAVNPWGMAWGRRQNESNVDLNRNWRRDRQPPCHNDAYDAVHPLVCPDTPQPPSVDGTLSALRELARIHGTAWVRDAITLGQYRHPDGLHYGGARTEASTRIVEEVVGDRLAGVERLLTVDLHTGHGPAAALTLLCDQPPDSAQHRFLCGLPGPAAVEATAANPAATTGVKSGQIANGFAELFPGACCFATSAEFGTVSDGRQLVVTLLEQWAYRRGCRSDAAYRDIVWDYRCCFTPDDAQWTTAAMASGRQLLDVSVTAVCHWEGS